MTTYGYARVSTDEQDLTVQLEALKAAGCTVIRSEKKSGTSLKGRTELETLMEFMQAGDTLVITRIDRLARSMLDLQTIVHELKGKGVALKATEQPIDTGSAAGSSWMLFSQELIGRGKTKSRSEGGVELWEIQF